MTEKYEPNKDHSGRTAETPTEPLLQRPSPDWGTPRGSESADATVRFERPIKNSVPLGTLVFGLIVLSIGLLMLGQLYLDVVINPAIVTVSILIGAGLIMVVGGIAAVRKGSTTDHTQTKG
ncbi:phage holin family protein [Zhihengliuella flava]|uniref:Uncharacterized protein n=1 Tax=Zhihengliuella flava TaxID=1285193 RepID=A0A931D813_9MICC|nr:phage holin family protein [Zhihengliuella flava]MBG6085360.1 hypothetical protein [Zhihengliuella flava]